MSSSNFGCLLFFNAATLVAAQGVLAITGAVFVYRERKLAILEPRQLQAELVWSGERSARCTLLMIGDSHVARWRADPPPGWRIARLGFSGESAVNIARFNPATTSEFIPDALLIAAGSNDASAAALLGGERVATLDRAADAVDHMILTARAAGVKQIVVMTLVLPRSPKPWSDLVYGRHQEEMLSALSTRIEGQARARGAVVLDSDALARNAQGRFRPELRADALHWSAAGYDVLAAALWDRLEGECP